MNKKGFTLIELLAVIVILAIIALIATPLIMDSINTAKKNSVEITASNYVKAIENKVSLSNINEIEINDGIYTVNSDGNITNGFTTYQIDVKGDRPNKGLVRISGGVVIDFLLTINNYRVNLLNNKIKVNDNIEWSLIFPQDAANNYFNHIELNIPLNLIGKINLDFNFVTPLTVLSHPMIFRNNTTAQPYIYAERATGTIIMASFLGTNIVTPNKINFDNTRQLITFDLAQQTSTNTLWYGSWQDISWSQSSKLYGLEVYGLDKKTLLFYAIPVPQGNTDFSTTPAPSNCVWDFVTKQYFTNKGNGTFAIEMQMQ